MPRSPGSTRRSAGERHGACEDRHERSCAPHHRRWANDGDARRVLAFTRSFTSGVLKVCYAAFTKGTTALLAAVQALAEHEGVERPLLESWRRTLPDVARQSEHAAAAVSKAWRWSGEMEEIAASFGAAGPPEGFHRRQN